MSDEEKLVNLSQSQDSDSSTSAAPPSQINARTKIVDILTRVETRQAFTDKLLEREINTFEEADRGLITEVVYGVLRWRLRLDWYLRQLYVGEYENLIPDVKNNLRSSVYQLMYLDKIPPYAVLNEAVEIAKNKYNQKTANLVNAILRNFLRQRKKLEYLETQLEYVERLSIRYSHPLWLVQRWIEEWGVDHTIRLCVANNERPTLAVRINYLQAHPETLFKSLEEAEVDHEVHPDFPEFVRIKDFSEFRKLDFLRRGWVSVQDVSTGIPVRLLNPQPGEKVLDMCAAPGGKAGYIGERMNNLGTLVCFEKHHSRACLLRDNLQRLGISHSLIVATDALQMPVEYQFDKILLDAPCTGFGVLSKRVDLKWKRTAQDIENMQQIQLQLLEAAARVLRIGGKLVYSTCTITPEENEQVVERFLKIHPEFERDSLKDDLPQKYLWDGYSVRTFPHVHDMDGSFAVRLTKTTR